MSKKHQYKETKDEDGEQLDPFFEMLQVLDVEQLIRFRRRLEMVGRKKMVAILTDEIKERDEKDKAEGQARQVQIKAEKAPKTAK